MLPSKFQDRQIHRFKMRGWKDLMQTEMTSGGCNNQIRQNKLENKGQKRYIIIKESI